MTLPPTRRLPHPYARRHLAAHAASGGRLDNVLNLETLPYLDEARLSTLLRLTEPAPLSAQWLLLSAFRTIRHRWSWDDPDANAAALDVAYLAVDVTTPLPNRWTASGLTWKPRIAEWQTGGTIVAAKHGTGQQLAIGAVRGVPTLVTGDGSSVRLWDPATGQPIGERLRTPSPINALALADGPGLVVAVCRGGSLITWDAVTHLPGATFEVSDPMPTALAVGEFEGRWVVAVGGERGAVQVREIDSGELVGEFGPYMPVRAVALAQAAGGLYLAIGHSDGVVGWVAVHDALSGELRHPGIPVQGEINDVTLAPMRGNLVVAAAVTDGAGIWDALSGVPMSSVRHDGRPVTGVALATIGAWDLLATGGHDRTARIWDAVDGRSMGPPLPHPAAVERVSFGEVDGRTMIVTGCLDGSARLWDPLRASGARVAVEGWFPSVAMDADVIVAGSEDGGVRLWEAASGNAYPLALGAAPDQPTHRRDVKVRLAGAYPRLLLEQRPDRVAIWDLSKPRAPVLLQQTEIGGMHSVDVHAARDVPLLATLDDADQVMVRDLVASRILFVTPMLGANSLRFIDAPDRPLLAVGADHTLHLLDIESGQHISDPLPVPFLDHAAVGRLDGTLVVAVPSTDGLRLSDVRTAALTIPPVEMPFVTAGVAWGRVGDRDVVVTAHSATVRVWNPRTGRKITELPFGTEIGAMSVLQIEDGRLRVAVSGPGLVVTELREIES